MDLYRLQMFRAAAKRGSLVAAARDLHLTPSAVSHGLKTLETGLECRLFDRVGKRVQLNQAGEQFLAQIEKPLALLDTAAEGLKRLGKWGQTRLRIGAAASVCQYILPGVLRELKRTFPNATVQVESGDAPQMVDLIQKNRIDLAVVLAPEQKTGLQVRPLFSDELCFTYAPSHPWARTRTIPRHTIPIQPFILYQRFSVTAQLVDDYFRAEQMVPLTIMEIASIEAIKELVKLNLGVAILAPWTASAELRQGALHMRPLGSSPLKRQWTIISAADRHLQMIEERFCQACRKFVASLQTDRHTLFRQGRSKMTNHKPVGRKIRS